MPEQGLFTRICIFIVCAQLFVVGVVYFFRLDAKVLAIPQIEELLEKYRDKKNDDNFWYPAHVGQRVWGYVDRHSVRPGEKFNVMLSHRPHQPDFNGRIEIYRIGWYEGKDRQRVWATGFFRIEAQERTPASTGSAGAGWNTAADVETDGWASGYYTIDILGDDGERDRNVAFIVVVDADPKGDILVKLPTNTYQAYSRFGGLSFYMATIVADPSTLVSFDRPTYPTFFDYEYYYVVWLEQLAQAEKLRVTYITDFDLHSNGSWPDNYKLLVSVGHDEYWSKEEFDAVERRLFVLGKNMLILSGNTAYWQIRYGDLDRPPGAPDGGRQLVCFKLAEEPIKYRTPDWKLLLTTKFRDLNRRPETMLIGVGLDSWFSADDPKLRYDYRVVDASLSFFDGTNWKPGDFTGNHVVGYEWDNRDPDRDGKRSYEKGVSSIAEIPADRIKVLFERELTDFSGKKGKAEAVYFETPAGAKVFNAGSIRWSWGVGKPEETTASFQTFNRNLIHYMLADKPEPQLKDKQSEPEPAHKAVAKLKPKPKPAYKPVAKLKPRPKRNSEPEPTPKPVEQPPSNPPQPDRLLEAPDGFW
jgi:hypothetical protein